MKKEFIKQNWTFYVAIIIIFAIIFFMPTTPSPKCRYDEDCQYCKTICEDKNLSVEHTQGFEVNCGNETFGMKMWDYEQELNITIKIAIEVLFATDEDYCELIEY